MNTTTKDIGEKLIGLFLACAIALLLASIMSCSQTKDLVGYSDVYAGQADPSKPPAAGVRIGSNFKEIFAWGDGLLIAGMFEVSTDMHVLGPWTKGDGTAVYVNRDSGQKWEGSFAGALPIACQHLFTSAQQAQWQLKFE